jgi:mRNA interferase HigB
LTYQILNKYRLIAFIHYNRQRVYIITVLMRKEHDKEKWKNASSRI